MIWRRSFSRPGLAGLLACSLAVHAGPAHIEAAVPQARVIGGGVFTYFGVKIYTAELYAGAQGFAWDAPFALDLSAIHARVDPPAT